MEKVGFEKRCMILALCITTVHTLLTFFSDRTVFTFPAKGAEGYALGMADYSVCKVITFLALFALYYSLLSLFMSEGRYAKELKQVLLCAMLYLPVIAVVLFIKLPQGFLTNDEISIYNNAVTLYHDTWFNILTTYYYIASLMIFPFKYGPIIVKVIIEFFVVGYTVFRVRGYFGKIAGSFTYIVFLLYPVIAYTTSAHRLPVYFLLYLALFVKLLFDRLSEKKLNTLTFILILFVGAALTQWRTEGIYLAVIIPILMLFSYKDLRTVRNVVILIAASALIQFAVSYPQNGIGDNLSGRANDRMKPFYAYTITNMYRNGLDLEKNKEDLAIVDKYLSLDAIRQINEYYEDINYEDVLILYKEGFIGTRPEAGVAEFIDYSEALKRIFVNNPDVFMRTRWGAFCYAAVPYHISDMSSGIVSFAFSVIKSISYNLFIPVAITVLLLIISFVKKKWYSFFFFGGLIGHWFIVFILAPASYFKYYFPIYIMAYFYVCILAIWKFGKGTKDIPNPL